MEYSIKDTKFKLIEGESIGEGGFNNVFQCSLVSDKGEIIDDNLVLKRLINENDLHQVARLDREMRYIEELDHENIMKPFYCDVYEGFIVMERYPMSLHQFIKDEEYSEEEYLKIFSSILNGVQYYIAENILHRDLKPLNILIDNKNTNDVKITDFGLSSKVEGHKSSLLTRAVHVGYTDFFSAPEQRVKLIDSDVRSEIYSLGKTLYVLATKDTTYHDFRPESIEPQLRHIIKKATNHNPDDRFQSISDFIKSFNMVAKKEKYASFKDYQLDNIVKEINSEIRNEGSLTEKFQRIFDYISDSEYEDAVDLMVKLDVDTHRIMWKIDADSYTNFMVNVCEKVSAAGFLFGFVDTIVSTMTSILEGLQTIMDIELQAQIISASVEVSTNHNRYWAMEVIAEYILEIENPVLLDNLKNGEHALEKRDIEIISQYDKSDKLEKLMIVE